MDLSQNLAGPYATQILADLGADVIKVEPPGGDPARRWGPPFMGGVSPLFLCGNRNKRSVAVDLKEEGGREALRRLVARADVFVQAFRAGVVDRLGFGYEAVRSMNPAILYVSVTAFGTEGPLRNEPGYDPLMQAYAGLLSVTGHPEGRGARVGTSIVDMGTGMWTAVAVMAALHQRDQDRAAGRVPAARHITTSLLDTAVAWMAYHLQGYLGSGVVPGRMGTGLGMIVPYEAFPAADGNVLIAAGNDASFRRLCGALGLAGMGEDPSYATNPARVERRGEVVAALADRTRREPVERLLGLLRDAAVPCAPIQDVAQVVGDPQVLASGMLRDLGEGIGREMVDVAAPMRWDGERPPLRDPPPRHGMHTKEILEELGLADGGDDGGPTV